MTVILAAVGLLCAAGLVAWVGQLVLMIRADLARRRNVRDQLARAELYGWPEDFEAPFRVRSGSCGGRHD